MAGIDPPTEVSRPDPAGAERASVDLDAFGDAYTMVVVVNDGRSTACLPQEHSVEVCDRIRVVHPGRLSEGLEQGERAGSLPAGPAPPSGSRPEPVDYGLKSLSRDAWKLTGEARSPQASELAQRSISILAGRSSASRGRDRSGDDEEAWYAAGTNPRQPPAPRRPRDAARRAEWPAIFSGTVWVAVPHSR